MVSRPNLSEDSLAIYGIPLFRWRAADLAGLAVGGTEDNGDHFIDEDTNTLILKGNAPNADTQTDISWTQFVLPVEYVSGGTVQFVVACVLASAPSGAKTVDLSVYEANRITGAVSADLVTTAAQTITDTTAAEYTFAITSTGLEPGSILNIKLTTAITDDGADGQV